MALDRWCFERETGDDPAAEPKKLADLVYSIYDYANSRGWDLDEAFYDLHCTKLGGNSK